MVLFGFGERGQTGRAAIRIRFQFRKRNMQHRGGRKNDRTLDKVFQFPNVSRPMIAFEGGDRFRGHGFNVPVRPTGVTLRKIADQVGNILAALA